MGIGTALQGMDYMAAKPAISNQQSAISNQQSAISNQQSAISNQQSAISNLIMRTYLIVSSI